MNLSASLLACGHSVSALKRWSVVRFNFFKDAMSAGHFVELSNRGVGRC